jgi:1-aminocyclopropane-1-carboxylate deaminase/D-cysteine desulfhydrase-like pyridoxal-dependent ACC family enzyme
MIQFHPSPLEKKTYQNKTIYVKRDDLLDADFSGNKARKFHYFLNQDLSQLKRIISSGSNQSNAMYSLSVLAKMKGLEFIYFCDHIPEFLKTNSTGNYKYSLQNGMKIYESPNREVDASMQKDEVSILIEEGGRQRESEFGIKILADELIHDIHINHIKNPYIFLPSGTGTTALYLQKNLPIRVYTCSTVGDDEYLREQWRMVENDETIFPRILTSQKKYHYGKLELDLYTLWRDLKENMGVTFDLMYDPAGWMKFLLHVREIEGTPLYIHQGGLIGNESMLARYQRKYSITT